MMHTKGPMTIDYDQTMEVVGLLHVVQTSDRFPVAFVPGWEDDAGEEAKRNARLLQAACTSYDKHCGERAVECAEADLLGQALEALERTKPWLTSYPGGGAIPVYDQVCAVLALSKGEK